MNASFLNLLVLILALMLASCEQNAFFDAGENTSHTFSVDTFYTLEVKDIFEIELQNADENKIIAFGGSNLLPNLNFYVIENKLFLENNNKYDWSRQYEKIKLILQSTSLNHINVRIPCKITTAEPFRGEKLSIIDWEKFSEMDIEVDVKQFRFGVSSDNAGIYKFSGMAESVKLRPWGSCFVYAESLLSKRASITHSSIGDCFVNVSDKLDIEIDETGTIYYQGNPEVNILHKSAGHIVWLQY